MAIILLQNLVIFREQNIS